MQQQCSHRIAALALVAVLSLGTVDADVASPEVSAAQVRRLRTTLAKVMHTKGLTGSLMTEAEEVDQDAAHALDAKSGGQAAFKKVMAEYAHFISDVTGRGASLRHANEVAAAPKAEGSTANLSPEMVAHAAEIAKQLEVKVTRILGHIKSDTGLTAAEEAQRGPLVARLQKALEKDSSKDGDVAVVERTVRLHEALSAAHDFVAERQKDLAAQKDKLAGEIDGMQAKILYMMLKPRKKLPLQSQFAMLHRKQFVNNTYAQRLLKTQKDKHDTRPLAQRMLSMLPEQLQHELNPPPKPRDRLAAGGSEGRVHVISSRMVNTVRKMMADLTSSRDKIAQLMNSKEAKISEVERKKAGEILKGIDEVLARAKKTKDLKTQLEAMDEMQKRLRSWMR
eukprot:gnl/TRDRNA2_/TRDRNA2_186214_c0_seq1.p1 gnl/TRDRNA2_/TRDRNA2_186214_c0~~gnl/TRDRNA2_/TRDRNA2_186214_c0_seq1.p1  ORF type:complete len:394 (+),score=133.25 gnl/TRDRNA2_/TRDRNA2_186214_c0_seq1:63-1244(+)